MMGTYTNAGRVNVVPISTVPGAQYRITAWALDNGIRRSATPIVGVVTTREASELLTTYIYNRHC